MKITQRIALWFIAISMPCLADTAPQIQHATTYTPTMNVSNYYVSEKLDGIRGYWNGKNLVTRRGTHIHTPEFFTKGWPSQAMEGELWSTRGSFEKISSIVRKKRPNQQEWQTLRFMIFDLPHQEGGFEIRVKAMKRLVKQTKSPFLESIKQHSFSSQQALIAHLNHVVNEGGEGLMLHHKASIYQKGRNKQLMKLKPHFDDEAIVIAHLEGQGKYKNMLGALRVKTPDGISFNIGTGFSDRERTDPPPIGSIITFKYHGKTAKGVPRFASYLRIRRHSTKEH